MTSILICNVINSAIVHLFGNLTKSKNITISKQKIICSIVFFAILQSLFNFSGASKLSAIFTIVQFILILLITFKISISYSLFFGFLLIICNFFSELLTVFFINCINPELNILLQIKFEVYTFSLLLSNLLFLVSTISLAKFCVLLDNSDIPIYKWLLICIPFITIAAFLSIDNYISLINNNKNILFLFVCLFISNLLLLFLFYQILNFSNLQKKIHDDELEKNFLKQKFNLMNKIYNNNFLFVHNFLNESTKISKLINSNDNSKAIEKLNSLVQNSLKDFNGIITGSSVLNEILQYNKNELNKKNIYLKSTITYIKDDFISLDLQYDLFTSIIDFILNTFEFDEKNLNTINLSTESKVNSLLLKLSISCQTNVTNINEKLKFSKLLYDNFDIYIKSDFNKDYKILKIIILLTLK